MQLPCPEHALGQQPPAASTSLDVLPKMVTAASATAAALLDIVVCWIVSLCYVNEAAPGASPMHSSSSLLCLRLACCVPAASLLCLLLRCCACCFCKKCLGSLLSRYPFGDQERFRILPAGKPFCFVKNTALNKAEVAVTSILASSPACAVPWLVRGQVQWRQKQQWRQQKHSWQSSSNDDSAEVSCW